MSKKGFTLVELLAVIAILAILVIIALPNVMGMFNTAKENSFKTEVKEIYKTAQQQWIQDSMHNTGEQTYIRCSTCTGKNLNLSGRSELNYFIKFNKAGDVIEYYATDGTFQYEYNNDEPLKIESINTINKIAELNKNEIIKIENNDAYTGDGNCKYKIVTDEGSFSSISDEKELCIKIVYDDYHLLTNSFTTDGSSNGESKFVLSMWQGAFSENSYIRVKNYDTNEIIYEMTYDKLPPNRYDMTKAKYLKNVGLLVVFDDTEINYTVENSSDMAHMYNTSYTNQYTSVDYTGPWITDGTIINKLETFEDSLHKDIVGFEKEGNNYKVILRGRK